MALKKIVGLRCLVKRALDLAGLSCITTACKRFRNILDRAHRDLNSRFLLLRNFGVFIAVMPPVCFILALFLFSMFPRY